MTTASNWEKAAFLKLARLGAIVFLPTREGKYLMQVADADDESAQGKLRPPGGGKDTKDKNLTETIVREIHEEFGIPKATVRKKVKFLGYEYRDEFWGNAVFEMRGHGLHPGVYQASNDPDEKVRLVEAKLDSKKYVGPDPSRLITEEARKYGDKLEKAARYMSEEDLKEIGRNSKIKLVKVYMHDPSTGETDSITTHFDDKETLEQAAVRAAKDLKDATVDETAVERMPKTEDGDYQCRVLLPGKAKEASTDEILSQFKPDLTPDEMEERAEVQSRLYHHLKPRLASMESWPTSWTSPDDSKGWVEWYQQFHQGRRHKDDARQIKRWLAFRARHGSQFKSHPTPRRAWALVNWGIDPERLLPEDQRQEFHGLMEDYKERIDARAKSAKTGFHQPENFDPIKDLSTRDFVVNAGGNDWEETWSGVTFEFTSGRRVWANLAIPDVLASEKGERKPGEDKDWGRQVVEQWIAAAKAKRGENSSYRPEHFLDTADTFTEIKDYGQDRQVWEAVKAAAISGERTVWRSICETEQRPDLPRLSNTDSEFTTELVSCLEDKEASTYLEEMARRFPPVKSGFVGLVGLADEFAELETTLTKAAEKPFHGTTHYKGCGCTERCRCSGPHGKRELEGDCPLCKAGVKKKASTTNLTPISSSLTVPVDAGGVPVTGPEAIQFALQNLDMDSREKDAMDIVRRKLKSKRPDAVKVLGYIDGLKRMGYQPHELMLTKVPVIPPQFRPYSVAGDTFVPGDVNELYRDLINLIGVHRELEGKLGQGASFNRLNVYDAVSALYGFGDPTSPKTKERGVSGFLKKVTGVNPKFCYDDLTEILTRNYGWVLFKDLPEDTEVATINPETLRFEWQQPDYYTHAPYSGELVQFKIGHRIDLLVTPSHRMWRRWRAGAHKDLKNVEAFKQGWSATPAWKLAACVGRYWTQTSSTGWSGHNELPACVKDWPSELFAQWLGWWLAEGDLHTDGTMATIWQTQANLHYCNELDLLFEKLQATGLKFKKQIHRKGETIVGWGWRLNDVRPLVDWLKANCGSNCYSKKLPRTVLDWDMDLLMDLFAAYLKGDGNKRLPWPKTEDVTHRFRNPFTDSHAGFVTTSRALFDGWVEVGLKLGLTVYRRKDYPELRRPDQAEQFAASVVGRWNCVTEDNEGTFIPYEGHVHCCSVPNGLLLVRRNGKTVVSGNSYVQRRLLSKDQDYVARGVIGVDPELSLDQIGVPEEVLWSLYSPYIQRALVRSGMSAEQALRGIRDRTDAAAKMLDRELTQRPVIYSRAPSWHKFNVISGYPKRIKGDMIRINPLVTTGLNADFDGDTMNIHLPSLPEAVQESKEKLLPSKMLFSIKDRNKVMPTPKQEFIMGLYNAQRRPARNVVDFPDEQSALAAVRSGKVALSDEITIGGKP